MQLVLLVLILELFCIVFLWGLFVIVGLLLHLMCHHLTYILSVFSLEKVFFVPHVISVVPVSMSAGWSRMLSASLCLRYLNLDLAVVVLVVWNVHSFVEGEG